VLVIVFIEDVIRLSETEKDPQSLFRTLCYTRFHLPHNIQLQEPEEEIPLDEYRSYHRDKRSSKDTAR